MSLDNQASLQKGQDLSKGESTASSDAEAFLSSFCVGAQLGEGSFGKVHLVRQNGSGATYALKTMKKSLFEEQEYVHGAQAEREILAKCTEQGAPFTLRLHVAFQTKNNVHLLTDAMRGDMLALLEEKKLLEERDTRFYAGELLLAVEFLHELGVAHRDIKPDNIFIDEQGHVALGDFGLAKTVDGLQQNSWCGSAAYVAPEVHAQGKFDPKCADYWAVGVFIFSCLCGRTPFEPKGAHKLLPTKRVVQRVMKSKLQIPKYVSKPCQDLLRGLLAKDPKKRLTDLQQIRQYSWFEGLDWDRLRTRQDRPPFIPEPRDMKEWFGPHAKQPRLDNLFSSVSSSSSSQTGSSSSGSESTTGEAVIDETAAIETLTIESSVTEVPATKAPSTESVASSEEQEWGEWDGFSFVAIGMRSMFGAASVVGSAQGSS